MATAKSVRTTLDQFMIGTRLLVRSRTDWRFAAVSKIAEERVVLTVCSPTGRTYRLRRDLDTEVILEGKLAIIPNEADDTWRDNFGRYDVRW
ncbi:MAG: hypothetical protein IPM59_14170 [Chloracidobacterium sp.]|nr:hypothetical protein [Chloracidobacterium sp.]